MAEPPQDQFTAGAANLRETTKWLVGGLITTAVAVLVGSPLTSLGALDLGPRLIAALVAAAIAYVLLGVLLWRALGVVAAETISIQELAEPEGPWATAAAARIEARVVHQMPGGCATFADLATLSEFITKDRSKGSGGRFKAFTAEMARFKPQLGFEYKRDRFIRLRSAMFLLMPFVILGVGIFAWGANPPPRKLLSDTPRYGRLWLEGASLEELAPALKPECYPADRGGTAVPVLVVSEFEGRSELVTLPAVPGCTPVRLTQQNGRVFAAK